jgi:CRP/FNR family transcriptional regulator, cyclic AMP receptor protein
MGNEQDILSKYGRTYHPEEVIFKEGEIGSEMFIIQSGKVRISKRSKDVEKTLVILENGDFFGEMAVIDKGPRSASATAVEETKCIALNEELFEQQMQHNARIVKKILKNMSARLRDANKQIENLLIRDNNRRVANTLLMLAHKHGNRATANIKMDFDFSVGELAKMVGLENEKPKMDEIIDKLMRAKVITIEDGQIVIVSLENLEKFIKYLEMKEEFGL